MRQQQSNQLRLKFIIQGDSGVGKTALLLRFVENKFTTKHEATIGVDFFTRDLNLHGNPVRLQIWDTAGQERFNSVQQGFYRGAHGVILVYDICNRATFSHLSSWYSQAKISSDGSTFMLVGNKMDLESKREVRADEGKEFADDRNMQFIETSAKTSQNVEDMFISLANELTNNFRQQSSPDQPRSLRNLLDPEEDQSESCC